MEKKCDLKKPEFENQFIADEKRPLIPEGIYKAQCIKYEINYSHHKSRKIFLHFLLLDGEYQGTQLFMAMNLSNGQGKNIGTIPKGSKYYKQWVIANRNQFPARGAVMSPRTFKSGIYEVSVRTVKPKYPDGKTLMPECFDYSVIDFIIQREA